MTDMTVGNVMSAKLGSQSASKSKTSGDGDALIEQFAGIMSQNQQSLLDAAADYSATAGDAGQEIFSLGSVDSPQTNYEKLGTQNRQLTQAKDTEPTETVSRKDVQELAQSVEDTVKETMQVDDEQLEEAMETLGFSAVDLLQPQNLIQLVQSLTGSEDVSALLTNENFKLTMQDVSALLTDFQQSNGLTQDGFTDLIAQLSENIDELTEAVEDLLDAGDASLTSELSAELTDTEISQETPVQELSGSDEQPTTTAVSAGREPVADSEPVAENPQAAAVEEAVPQAQRSENSAQSDSGNLTDESADQTKEADTAKTQGQEDFTDALTAAPREAQVEQMPQAEIPQAATAQVDSYIELQSLMDQMDGLARTFASSDGTTVEMQLNPENLGRLTLSVSEKQGNVTAQIIASNEQVKEALQTQIVELRASLQAQGVKVQAVEVTVATHEFEQNLDGNTSANGQEQEEARQQAAQTTRRRNLDFHSLDELSGLMSEEETLAAQIMRDNGGSVDYTA